MLRRSFSYFGWIGMKVMGVVLVLAVCTSGGAADFPQKGKTIQMIIGYEAGGSTDVAARILASGLEKELGTSVLVVNKPGASSQISLTLMTQSKPDGYTIVSTNFPSTMVTYLDPARKAAYNRQSFEPVALHVITPGFFAVKTDSPFKTVKDLVDAAMANPNKIRISTSGVTSDDAFAVLQFQKLTGAKFAMVHFPKGTATAIPPFLGGKIEVLGGNVGDLLSQYKSGEVRILGIMDHEQTPFYPGVKTFEQQGYKIYSASSRGFSVPKGTPKDVVNILSGAIKKVVDTEDQKKRMADMALTLRYMNPAQYAKYWTECEEEIKELLPLTKE